MDRLYCVYIMTNVHNTVLYTGMTSDLKARVWQHKNHVVKGFSQRYRTSKLIYYEVCPGADAAIWREKRIKSMTRAEKERLIRGLNPTWRDLIEDL